MPIGATIGAGVLTAGAGIYSSSKASKAQSKAAGQAADTSLAVADKNNALYREIYGQNKALLTPYSNMGLSAGNALSDLLLGTSNYAPAAPPATTAPPAATGGALNGYTGPALGQIGSQSQMDAFLRYYQAHPDQDPGFTSITPFRGDPYTDENAARSVLAARNAWLASNPQGALVSTPPAAPPADTSGTVTTTAPTTAQDAWDRFRSGTNYQWRLNQGENALASNYSTHGAFDSGAEKKALVEYGQNFASNELSNYMNLLAGQQSMGLSAAAAVAGVGTNYAGNVAAQNTNAANAAANAALVSGQGQANMWGSVGQGVGQLGGALFQYGMGQSSPAMSVSPASSYYAQQIGNYGYSGGF